MAKVKILKSFWISTTPLLLNLEWWTWSNCIMTRVFWVFIFKYKLCHFSPNSRHPIKKSQHKTCIPKTSTTSLQNWLQWSLVDKYLVSNEKSYMDPMLILGPCVRNALTSCPIGSWMELRMAFGAWRIDKAHSLTSFDEWFANILHIIDTCLKMELLQTLRPLPRTRPRPVTITLQALSLVEKAEPVQVRFPLCLRDQRSMYGTARCM